MSQPIVRRSPVHSGRVVAAEALTPRMRRITVRSAAMKGVAVRPAQDLELHLQDETGRRVKRRYTIRHARPDDGEHDLDVLLHGAGAGAAWGASARPGDEVRFQGPRGKLELRHASWHVLCGDESALPAIAASLESVPAGSRAVVRLICDGPEHEIALSCPGDLDLAWVHRRGTPGDADLLPAAVEALAFPAGRVHAFVHGEADEIRAIRRHLLSERGLRRSDMSCSPYWRRTMTDEAWRQVKRDFVAQMDAEVEGAA